MHWYTWQTRSLDSTAPNTRRRGHRLHKFELAELDGKLNGTRQNVIDEIQSLSLGFERPFHLGPHEGAQTVLHKLELLRSRLTLKLGILHEFKGVLEKVGSDIHFVSVQRHESMVPGLENKMAAINPAEASDLLLERFGQITYQFLEASCEVWPDDEVLKGWKAKYDEANANPRKAKVYVQVLFAEFTRDFKSVYSRIQSKDATLLEEPFEVFVKIRAAAKFRDAPEDVRSTCWDYANQIVQAATVGDVYANCPEKMVERVASMADSIVKQMESGTFDMSKLNPAEISRQMMQDMKPEELEEWGRNLMSSGNMDSIMSMMGGLLGSGGLGALTGNAGALDPAMLRTLMSDPNMQMPDFSLFMPKKK
jgi:hypothetical protein